MLFISTTKSWNYEEKTEEITEFEIAPCPTDILHSNWAQYLGNDRINLKLEITIEIHKLYTRGKGGGDTNMIFTAEKAYAILNKKVIQYNRKQQMILSFAKIK